LELAVHSKENHFKEKPKDVFEFIGKSSRQRVRVRVRVNENIENVEKMCSVKTYWSIREISRETLIDCAQNSSPRSPAQVCQRTV